jgi:hypothetical protein
MRLVVETLHQIVRQVKRAQRHQTYEQKQWALYKGRRLRVHTRSFAVMSVVIFHRLSTA